MKLKKLFIAAAAILTIGTNVMFAQVSAIALINVTNIPPVVLASQVTNGWTGQPIPLTKNCCAALALQLYTTNVLGSGSIGGSFSVDGTNFGLYPFFFNWTCGSNTAAYWTTNTPPVTAWTNWTQPNLSGLAAVQFNCFTNNNSTSSVFNAGIKLNRPTLNINTY